MNFQAQSLRLSRKAETLPPPDFSQIISAFESAIRIDPVATDLKVVLALLHQSPLPVARLQDQCRVSPAKFFAVLGSLHQRNIVSQVTDPSDRRRRLYALPAGVRAHVCNELNRCAEAAMGLADDVSLCALFEESLEAVARHYGLARLPFRFTILSSLFKAGDWSPGEGLRLANTSQVSFFSAMEGLKASGIIECFNDPADRRKKRCRLTPPARQTFAEAVQAIKSRLVEYIVLSRQ